VNPAEHLQRRGSHRHPAAHHASVVGALDLVAKDAVEGIVEGEVGAGPVHLAIFAD
jgi:hypothetical protein